MGMPPEVMARIVDPFFTTKSREGTGLGLSISQMLMAEQGGGITVRSQPGEGTAFTVWLPASEDAFREMARTVCPRSFRHVVSKGWPILVQCLDSSGRETWHEHCNSSGDGGGAL